MEYINKDVENWITGIKYSKLKKNKINNDLEYSEITKNFKPKSRTQWTNTYGEELVKFLLKELGYNVKKLKPKVFYNKKKFLIDIETADALWEIKTRNWTTTGTAGEKILGTPIKYSEVPKITNKPLYIVLVAYQEYEAIHNFNLFDSGKSNKNEILNFINTFNIEYIKCSDLLYKYQYKKVINSIKLLKIKDQ